MKKNPKYNNAKKKGYQKKEGWQASKPGNSKWKQQRPTNKQNKLHIKFDLEDRKDYLTGFRKRKKERQEKAMKQIDADLKAEMKQMKKDRVDLVKKIMYQGMKVANGEIGDLDDDDDDDDDVMMSTCGSTSVEIRGLDLTSSQHHIGTNQMDLTKLKPQPPKKKKPLIDSEDEEGEKEEEEDDVSIARLDELGIHSQKDLYRSLKKSTFQIMKKSSLMKMKQARDAKKQRKAQARVNNHRKKLMKKKNRHKRPAPSEEK